METESAITTSENLMIQEAADRLRRAAEFEQDNAVDLGQWAPGVILDIRKNNLCRGNAVIYALLKIQLNNIQNMPRATYNATTLSRRCW